MKGFSQMVMYSLSVRPPSAITQAIAGNFMGTKEQQIITACGSMLTMYRVIANEAKLQESHSHDTFGIVRSIAAFRLAGSSKDFIIISADSGRVIVVEYVPEKQQFEVLKSETFGKSGVRRVIPGQFLAADPKGRACMLASMEKNKLVYVLNRDSQAQLTISSPLEAHKPGALVYALTGLDVGFENPVFASLEVDHTDTDHDPTGQAYKDSEKQLVYYELDLGLNHVVRKWADAVERTANLLLHVPGGADGPSGALVCSEELITYRHRNQDTFRVAIPRREGRTEDPDRKRYVVCGAVHKMKGGFFFLIQTEDGDIFKLNIEMVLDKEGNATSAIDRLVIKYFDTVPVATELLILKAGTLFVACESGDKLYYQFSSLADDDHEFEWTSYDFPLDSADAYKPVYFPPRYEARNLERLMSLDALDPVTAAEVANLTNEDAPQIYSVHGTGARSTFRTTKYGLRVTEIVGSELPDPPKAVWTTKTKESDEYDKYIILSFSNATLVLEIGDTIVEASDSGFLKEVETLAVQRLGDEGLLQIHPRGVRHISSGRTVTEWPVPPHRTIVAAATNSYQVAIGLSSGEIVYFELDVKDGSLEEYQDRAEMDGGIKSLSLGDVPEGRMRSPFLAVGCDDLTVRILRLTGDSALESASVQALTAMPTALHIMPMEDATSGAQTLYLHIGLQSGVYLRVVLDEINGSLSETRTRFLGPRPVKLYKLLVHGRNSILALSSRAWLGYPHPQTKVFTMTPLDCPPLQSAAGFTSEQCLEGLVGVSGRSLRICLAPNVSENMVQKSLDLTYTPRKIARHPELPLYFVAETDYGVMAKATRMTLDSEGEADADAALVAAAEAEQTAIEQGEDLDSLPEKNLRRKLLGYARGRGHWASCIEIVDPVHERVLNTFHLDAGETITSLAVVPFTSKDNEVYACIGTAVNLSVQPRTWEKAYISIYHVNPENYSLTFVHKTEMEEPAMALAPFHGRLLAGVGTTIRIYDIGIKQVLRKAQLLDTVPRFINGLQTMGNRILVSDHQESVTFASYKPVENVFIRFADDAISRWTTAANLVDYDTAAGGDKFGNLWIVRCPKDASIASDEPGAAAIFKHERSLLQGAPNKVDLMSHFFTQDIPMSVQKCQLLSGSGDVLVWTGLQGTIGVLIPFVNAKDVEFFTALETAMRKTDPPLSGRDHLIYRGYYVPVKGTIDGDLCERYLRLPNNTKAMMASELEMTVREVEGKITDFRERMAW